MNSLFFNSLSSWFAVSYCPSLAFLAIDSVTIAAHNGIYSNNCFRFGLCVATWFGYMLIPAFNALTSECVLAGARSKRLSECLLRGSTAHSIDQVLLFVLPDDVGLLLFLNKEKPESLHVRFLQNRQLMLLWCVLGFILISFIISSDVWLSLRSFVPSRNVLRIFTLGFNRFMTMLSSPPYIL